jgi:hypothetical protein
MRPPRKALVTGMARNSRFHGHQLPNPQILHPRTNLDHPPGTFMPDNKRVLHHLTANPSGFIIMHITAADTDFFNLEKDIGITNNRGRRNIPHLNLTYPG